MNFYWVTGIAVLVLVVAVVMMARSFVRGMEKDLEGY
jgi:hypothetical protein